MTDFVITKVRYADNNNFKGKELYLAKVHIFNNTSKKLFNTRPYNWTRHQIIGAMREGKKFNTYYKPKNEAKFKLGSKIKIYKINGQSFIKTENNKVEGDNITELPEF